MEKNEKLNYASYQPEGEWKELLPMIQRDIEIGENNLNTSYRELDGRSIREAFYDFYQSFIGSNKTHASSDPESSWQSYIHKPYIMNKAQTFIAHAIASIIYPEFTVRTDDGQTDNKELAKALNVLAEYNYDEMDYVSRVIKSVTGVCYMPYVIIEKGYANGKHYTKMVDPTTFKYSNPFEEDIQKQRFVIKENWIDEDDAEQLYGKHENWKYVESGENCYWDSFNNYMTFNTVPADQKHRVKETVYFNRSKNLQLTLINGIPVCKPDQKIKRKVGYKKGRPYPFARIIFEDLGMGTMFGRPLAQKLWSEELLASRLQSMVYDMTRQAVAPARLVKGSEGATAQMFAPGSLINSSDPNFQVESLGNDSNLNAGYNMMQYLDKQASENSASDALRSGVTGSRSTAREIVAAQQNAQIQLGTFIKNMENFAEEIAYLTMDDIFQYDFVKKIDELTGNIEYKSEFVMSKEDKKKLIDLSVKSGMSEAEKELEMLKKWDKANERGYESIYSLNPELVENIDFRVECSYKNVQSKSMELQKALAVEYHTMMINTGSPNYNRYEGDVMVTEQFYPNKVDILINNPEEQNKAIPMGTLEQPQEQTGQSLSEDNQGTGGTLGQLMGASLPPETNA